MISINFATQQYRTLEMVRKGFVLAAVGLAIAFAALVWAAMSLRTDIATIEKKTREVQASAEQIQPLLDERDRLIKQLGSMSGLVQSRRFSWTGLCTSLEKAFPVGVAVDKVEYNRKESLLSLDGQALSPEALRNLMIGLERAPGFRNPYLKHQSIDKGTISFHVVASYQLSRNAAADREQ